MHQPLDVAKPGERRRVVAQAPFQAGQDAIADHQADIPAAAGFLDSLLDPLARFVRLQRQAAQVAAVQQEPPAHRVAALRRQVLEAFQALAHLLLGARHLAARLEDAGAVVMDQCLEQRVAVALGELQGVAVVVARLPEVATGHRQVAQRRQALQAGAIALPGEVLQGLAAVRLGLVDIAAAARDHPAQGLPLGQQVALRGLVRRRQETRQLAGQFFRGIQLAGQRQRPAVQQDQARRARQEAVRQVHLPAQQGGDVLLRQQLLFRQVLHQARRHVRLAGAQRLLHRLVEQAMAAEPAAGAQVQGAGGRTEVGQGTRQQQVGEQVVVAEPLAVFVQRHEEDLVLLQVVEDRRAVAGLAHGIAELGAEALEARGLGEERLDLGRLPLDHLLQQVVADQFVGAVYPGADLLLWIAARQQPEAQPGDPAFAALEQRVQRVLVEFEAAGGHQRPALLGGQAQVLFAEFEQLPRQAQARQVPVRPLPAGDQQHQALGQVIEEELQATVEHRALGQVVIVQHQ
ncbi:hypothetical protein PAERUG_E16_London_17_VIM_2_04_14_03229 [Pseudomonas aeruginosa]|nr:hypothetical protein PAERUG_E16_London_17_VIM_2_04_14_03229 [Pseudomonas aeruginosa]